MQRLPVQLCDQRRRLFANGCFAGPRRAAAIHGITDYRVFDMGQMDPNLVGPTGFQAALHQRRRARAEHGLCDVIGFPVNGEYGIPALAKSTLI